MTDELRGPDHPSLLTPHSSLAADRQRLREIMVETQAFRRGEFVLSSGRRSTYYIDGRLATLHPEGAYLAGRVIFEHLRGQGIEAVGGLTLGADPIVTAVAIASFQAGEPIAAFIVRKEPKAHGTGQQIEGPLRPGARVAVIEDAVTTGGSALKAIVAAEQLGCAVVKAVALVDRLEGGKEALAARGIPLESIFTIRDFGVDTPTTLCHSEEGSDEESRPAMADRARDSSLRSE